jgi:hypothetical protein
MNSSVLAISWLVTNLMAERLFREINYVTHLLSRLIESRFELLESREQLERSQEQAAALRERLARATKPGDD